MFKIAKSKLPELLKAIAAQQELFLPVNNNGQVNFAAWFEGCNADIETPTSSCGTQTTRSTGKL